MSYVLVRSLREVSRLQDGVKQKAARDLSGGSGARSSEALIARLYKGRGRTTAKADADSDHLVPGLAEGKTSRRRISHSPRDTALSFSSSSLRGHCYDSIPT